MGAIDVVLFQACRSDTDPPDNHIRVIIPTHRHTSHTSHSQTFNCTYIYVEGYQLLFFFVMSEIIHSFFVRYLSHRLSVVGLRPSSSLSMGCAAPLRGD